MSLAQNWPKTAKFSWRCSFIFNDNSIEVLRSNCFHGISGCHSLSDLKHRAWKHGHWFYFVSYKKKTTKQKGLRFRTYSVFESSFSGSSFLKLQKYLSLKLLYSWHVLHKVENLRLQLEIFIGLRQKASCRDVSVNFLSVKHVPSL